MNSGKLRTNRASAPSLTVVVGLLLILLGLNVPNEFEWLGLNWPLMLIIVGVTISLKGILTEIVELIPRAIIAATNCYRDHKRYRLEFDQDNKWVKKLIIKAGIQRIRIKVQTRVDDVFAECRVSPQQRLWWQLWGHQNEASGVFRILGVCNLIPEYDGDCTDRDDEKCGRWVKFDPPFERRGGANLDFECCIKAEKPWKGEMGFLSLPKGRRSALGRIEVKEADVTPASQSEKGSNGP